MKKKILAIDEEYKKAIYQCHKLFTNHVTDALPKFDTFVISSSLASVFVQFCINVEDRPKKQILKFIESLINEVQNVVKKRSQ